jgi:apolipoprotein N-acyltransferase
VAVEAWMEIPEREWLEAGFFWIVLALLAALPWIGNSIIGAIARLVVCIVAAVHVGEAVYASSLARSSNLDPSRWMLRTLVLGYLSLRRLRELAASGAHPV